MDIIKKIFPLIPKKGDVGFFVISLFAYFLGPFILCPIACIILALTLILAVLVPIVNILVFAYCFFGFVISILSFTGALNTSTEKSVDSKDEKEEK